MSDKQAEDKSYKPEMDVVLAEADLGDQFVAQVRQYKGGEVKVGVFYPTKRGLFAEKRIPAKVARAYAAAIEAFFESGVLTETAKS